MIVFHEGLPGAGKSYEACLMHILPALKAGRKVLTNIEGINHEMFAKHTGIPEALLKLVLITIYVPDDPDQQKRLILEKTEKDSLIVLDEIQNIFPADRAQLPAEWIKYVAEHRHEGLDIILMGQDRRDLHAIWRRRIQRCIVFTNQAPVGRPGHYKWEAYEATTPEKYQKISSGSRKYESQYFGLYSSYTEGTEHKKVYADKRSSIFKSKGFTVWIPIFAVVLVWAGMTLFDLFTGKSKIANTPAPKPVITAPHPKPVQSAKVAQVKAEPEPEPEYIPVDSFDDLAHSNRPRLAAFLKSMPGSPSHKEFAQIEIVDSSDHTLDVFDLASIHDLGWKTEFRSSGLVLKKKGREYLVRPWPRDSKGRVSNETRKTLKSGMVASFTPPHVQTPGVVLLE